MILCVIFVMLAVILKGNNIIGSITIAICVFLRILKEKKMEADLTCSSGDGCVSASWKGIPCVV